ncbi:hypothetical protein [Pedobacter sp. UYP24]
MKNIIFLIALTLLFSCKKGEISPETLNGRWEVRHVLGVQVAGEPSELDKGNGSIIEFSGENYKKIENGVVITKGTFKITNEYGEVDGNRYEKRIIYDDDTDWRVLIKISGNKLIICNGSIASDGTTMTYEKL